MNHNVLKCIKGKKRTKNSNEGGTPIPPVMKMLINEDLLFYSINLSMLFYRICRRSLVEIS